MDDEIGIEMVKAFFGIVILSMLLIGTAVVVVWATGNLFNAMAPLGTFIVLMSLVWEDTKSR